MADSPITEGIIERLMTGVDTEDIYIGDVSDVQLYGQQYLRRLSGQWKESASELGCDPVVYQSILWWTLVWIPIVPLKSFFVMPYLEWKEEAPGMDRYRCLPAPPLPSQIAVHYAMGLIVVGATVLLFWWGHSRNRWTVHQSHSGYTLSQVTHSGMVESSECSIPEGSQELAGG